MVVSFSYKVNGSGEKYKLNNTPFFVCEVCQRSYRSKTGLYVHKKYYCGKEAQFKCPYCPYKAKQTVNLKSHVMLKHQRGENFYILWREPPLEHQFQCEACLKIYKSKAGFYLHQKFDCGKEPQFQCPQCPHKSKRKGDLKRHMATHFSAVIGNGYCCDKCGKNYSYSGSLKRHQKYECGKEPQFQCPYCSHKAKHRSNLKSHMIYMHSLPYVCTKCNKGYRIRQSLYSHQKHECGKDPQFHCPYCTYGAKQKASLKRHIICVADFPYVCNRCNKAYRIKNSFYKHQKFDCGLDPQFHCPHCSYRAKHKTSLKRHLIFKHLSSVVQISHMFVTGVIRDIDSRIAFTAIKMLPYVCTQCNKGYRIKQSLYSHQKHECGIDPQFPCPYCPYKAKQKPNLKRHIHFKHYVSSVVQCSLMFVTGVIRDIESRKAFTAIKTLPFVCTKCNKGYRIKQSLYSHQKHECGIDPQFPCPYCPYKAKQKPNLKKHIVLKHHQPAVQSSFHLSVKSVIEHTDLRIAFTVTRNMNVGRSRNSLVLTYVFEKSKVKSTGEDHLLIYLCILNLFVSNNECIFLGHYYASLKQKQFKCDTCEKAYTYKAGLYQHKKYECGKEPQFQCPHCPYRSKQKATMKTHICNVHLGNLSNSPYKANKLFFVPLIYKKKLTIQKEVSAVHLNNIAGKLGQTRVYSDETVVQKPFNCDCGKSYRYRAGLYTHRKFECGKEPQFPCPVCSYRATRKSSLKVHMYSEFQMFDESNKFICHCGKKYRHRKSLWNHTNFECGGKEPQFSCPYCSYSARLICPVDRTFVKEKKNKITGLAPRVKFACDSCSRSYMNKVSLSRHKRYECGKEPQFSCPYCPYKSYHKCHLRLHIFHIHNSHLQ
nr:zinc finger protein Xfin-like [Halyomorpha halys]